MKRTVVADQGDLARWPGREARARPLYLAVGRQWHGGDHSAAARLFARRHRLANAAKNLASDVGGMSKTAGPAGANMIPSRHDRCGRSAPRRPCQRACDDPRTRREAEAVAARAQAVNSHSDAPIAWLRLEIKKLKRDIHGSRSERKARLLEQMELQLEELEADASEDEVAAEMAARSSTVRAFERKRTSAQAFPRASAARARRHCRANQLPVLRFDQAGKAGRGCYRDAGGDPASVEGDPVRAREVHLPRMREDYPAYAPLSLRRQARYP